MIMVTIIWWKINGFIDVSTAKDDEDPDNLKILVILEYIPNFFSKRPLSPLEREVVLIGTLFHPGATLKFGERGKCRKYAKAPI